jgi:predicted metallopeptidase
MTAAQHKAQLRRVIKEWVRRLGLTHYNLEIAWDEEPDEPDAMASIWVSDNYDYATLRFRYDWMDHDVQELNRIVVHELVHIMSHEFAQASRSIEVTGALSTDLRILWHDRCRDAEERMVDRLATRFIELGGVVE